jgi:hypothetical protein
MFRIKQRKFNNRFRKNNKGTTLIEVIVCFLLLSIFMVAASIFISTISSIYYSVKNEIYAREVSDIVLEKIESEIDGAEYFKPDDTTGGHNPTVATDYSSIDLCDKTDTHVKVMTESGKMVVLYYEIQNPDNANDPKNRVETKWSFDDNMYNGYTINSIKFYRGGITDSIEEASKYGVSSSMSEYSSNVVLVTMELKSSKNSVYYYSRCVKMYNVPDDYNWGNSSSNN